MQDFQFILDFIDANTPTATLRSALIFLGFVLDDVSTGGGDVTTDGDLRGFLSVNLSVGLIVVDDVARQANRDVIEAHMWILCSHDDDEVQERSLRLVTVFGNA